jgi:hypothetical protein
MRRGITVLAAAVLMLGTQVCAPVRAVAGEFKFDPLPTVTKDNAEVPDLDKMFDAKQLHFSLFKQPSKRNALLAWGTIARGDSERFAQAIKAAKPIEEIWLYSGGGSLSEGLQMGRLIHKAGLGTHLLSWMECDSACNFVFMGGTVRSIDPGGAFYVHMFSADIAGDMLNDIVDAPETFVAYNKQYPERELSQSDLDHYNDEHDDSLSIKAYLVMMVADYYIKEIQQDSAKRAADIARFLTEMGLSLRFLTAFAGISNAQPRELTRDELRSFNIINTE